MREIKFRGMTKANNIMVFGDLIVCPNGEHRIIWFELKGELPLDVDYTSHNEVIQSSTIGQFTGLQDRYGNDVYEGDVLETADRILKVVWHKHAGQWDTDFVRYKDELSSNGLINLEWKYRAAIIGNIYENPELLSTPTAVL
jgi:uncharacterized phage protein (TIGR01671 family)